MARYVTMESALACNSNRISCQCNMTIIELFGLHSTKYESRSTTLHTSNRQTVIAKNATTNMPTTETTMEKWEKQQSTKADAVQKRK